MDDAGAEIPVYKVGLVLLRKLASAAPQVLLVRTKPKNEGEIAPLVLPRGSRQYQTPEGARDVRNDATALQYRDRLEPLKETLAREAREEAGVPEALLQSSLLLDLGVMDYRSPKGPPRLIQWYTLALEEAAVAQLDPKPQDAAQLRWVTLAQMRSLAETGDARAGYVPVVEAAILRLGKKAA